MKQNVLFVLSGNCRTFIDCIDSCYLHIISKLFLGLDVNIHIYLYLKLTDPGPKGTPGWNFTYADVEYRFIENKINEIKDKYGLSIDYKLLSNNEITDKELLSQVKDRSKYIDNYKNDKTLIRGLHCHYNLERCGNYILEKEASLGFQFNYYVYIRPDLYFTEDCAPIHTYDNSKVTLCSGCYPDHSNGYANDHFAIIPKVYSKAFFFDRMNLYRNNTTNTFDTPETVYWHTINYTVRDIGKYIIKRP